ncbi:MAG: septal ring lytic transglycosylase RlpA family protein [Leptolyngbya sp.]|nr:septal ring lytic transglycosylase RlpA family protein [Candidatus Melainabacteria bacterium]
MRATKDFGLEISCSAPLMVALLIGSPFSAFGQNGIAEVTEKQKVEIVKGHDSKAIENASSCESAPSESSPSARMRITEYDVQKSTADETDDAPIPMKLYAQPKVEAEQPSAKSDLKPTASAKPAPISTTIMMPIAPAVTVSAGQSPTTKATTPVAVRPKIASSTPSELPPKGSPDFGGKAAFYSSSLHGQKTASGQRYDEGVLTAAHKQLPFGTKVTVVNRKNGKQCTLTINDRGPYCPNHVIDVSKEAAKQLGLMQDNHRMVDCFIKIDAKDLIRREAKKPPAPKVIGESL